MNAFVPSGKLGAASGVVAVVHSVRSSSAGVRRLGDCPECPPGYQDVYGECVLVGPPVGGPVTMLMGRGRRRK